MKQRGPWILIAFAALLAVASYYLSQPPAAHVAPDTTEQSTAAAPQPHQNVLPDGYGVTPATLAAPTRFVDVSDAAGLDYRWTLPGKTPRDILDTIGNGCAFIDFDHSGHLDILLIGDTIALYRSDGHGHFSDISHDAGLDRFHGHYLGCAVGDFDNDGFDDVFVSGYQTALLLHNDGGKRFQDVTSTSGIDTKLWSTSAAWGDVDNDGHLDLFVCNYCDLGDGDPICDVFGNGVRSACGPEHFDAQRGILYRNLGNGHFRDNTKAWGVQDVGGKDLGAAFADFDGSGRESLFVANDQVVSNLFKATSHGYKDIGAASGTCFTANGRPYAGMGVDWGDYDNDGRLDLAVMDFQYEDKGVFHNDGAGLFTNQFTKLGFRPDCFPWVAFGVKWTDYDNDGWLDLICTNGEVVDNIADVMQNDRFPEPTVLYHNNNGQKFDDVRSGLVGDAGREIIGRGLATGDYENNGKVGVLIVDSAGKVILLENQTPSTGHWLDVRLIGTKSNRDGFGALLTADTGQLKQLRQCQSDGSYMSASDPRIHFGLGTATTVKQLTILWPSGARDVIANVPSDGIVTVTEGSGKAVSNAAP